ncbi:baseplate multidomain protein megatron [Rhodobium gokarnense]|uniref:Host specificity protein n=1 Tax=Rhodobium gokarnense TaxID=364296 RepID=A0ABT3HBZ0_9HYPH|nr:glycoside hydrolase TIM-barrel-like domain-containing protein [Rhodobium gokarnense]MCW2307885.1 hypothetical protein [Rhodobium gokarnense]
MSTLVLQVAGQAVGGALFGSLGAVIGGAVGALAGNVIDRSLFAPNTERTIGAPLSDLSVQSSTEGRPIPKVYGRARIAGQVIWATDYEEVVEVEESGGGKGGGGTTTTTTYSYYANFAVALCEGPVTRIARIWADGKPLDQSLYDFRIHKGTSGADPDPLIEEVEGTGAAPGYRGTAYVVFERMPLEAFGNRLPQLTFEVVHVIDRLEKMVKAVTVIPSSTEFGYYDRLVTRRGGDGETISDNRHTGVAETDWLASIDELEELCPNLASVALVVAWFGDDLRCGVCDLKPGVEDRNRKMRGATWGVATLSRANAHLVSQINGRPAYGGTPSDETVEAAIRDLRSRGLRVVFYPFILMDVEASSGLPDPYGRSEQPPYPWRGRITCHPAPGEGSSPDKTSAARSQVENFVGTCHRNDFTIAGGEVAYTGPSEWSYRRMILHYAHLCEKAGGVDAFLIGAEMRGMTQVRSGAAIFPFVEALTDLAGDVRAVLRSSTKITYGADWSEYFGYQPTDGSGDVYFHLDPLWASSAVDMVGIDNYMPLADWRDGDHDDTADACSVYDLDYLRANVAGGEGFDWYYASTSDRNKQVRSPITDGAHGKPWVFRYKDLIAWWSHRHYDRPGGSEAASHTAWVPESKPIWFTELGCPAIDRGANQPNVFYDPKSSESFFPYFSSGRRDDFMQRRFLEATMSYWEPSDPDYVAGSNPISSVYGGRMLNPDNIHFWTWDARPYPAFPALIDVWSDGDNWHLGHWLTGRLGGVTLAALIEAVLDEHEVDDFEIAGVSGVLDGYVVDSPQSARDILEPLAATFHFSAVDSGRALRFADYLCQSRIEIDADDLAVEADDDPRMTVTRGQETELPNEVRIAFFDGLRDFESGAAAARRTAGGSARLESRSVPAIAPPSFMQETAEMLLHDAWAGRERFEFALRRDRVAIEPGDLVTLVEEEVTRPLLVTEVADAGLRRISARTIDPDVFRPAPAPAAIGKQARPTVFGAPDVVMLDLPVIDPDEPHHRPRIAVSARPWPGTVAVWRSATGASYSRVAVPSQRATIGSLAASLAPGPLARWDNANALTVSLIGGSLSSRDDSAVLAGANAVAVLCANGAWEVLQFAAADLVAESTYELTRLLRGQLGTEDAMAVGAPAGADFVVLNAAVEQVPIRTDEIDLERIYRIGPSRRTVADAAMAEVSYAAGGRGLKPFSPAHLSARRIAESGDVAFSWVRRTRIDGDGWSGRDVPLGEERERYLVEVLSGGTPARSFEVTGPAVTYAAADQAADFGALQDSYHLRVTQLGARVAGIQREAIVHV